MKAITYLNPRKRRKARRKSTRKRKTTARRAPRRVYRKRRVARRNPRRTTARRAPRRRVYRKRRVARRNPPIVRSARANPVRRRRRRTRRARRNPVSLGALVTKKLVLMAAGGISASFINSAVLESRAVQRLNLPGINNHFGDAVYRLLIPMGAGWALERFGPRAAKPFAKGLVLGGLINSLGALVGIISTKVSGTSMYFPDLYANQSKPVAQVGSTPGYSATNMAMRPMGSVFGGERAFPTDAWSGN